MHLRRFTQIKYIKGIIVCFFILSSSVFTVSAAESSFHSEFEIGSIDNTVSGNIIDASENNNSANTEKILVPFTDLEKINIEVPTNLPFVIDPYEISGRGQVYSEDFHFTNKGSIPVKVVFKEINFYFKNNIDFRAVSGSDEIDNDSGKKDICLMLQVKNTDEYLVITDEELQENFSLILEPSQTDLGIDNKNSQFTFAITGSVNTNVSQDWDSNDIRIELIYYFEPLENVENLIEDDETGEKTAEQPAEITPSNEPDEGTPGNEPDEGTPGNEPDEGTPGNEPDEGTQTL